MKAIFGGLNSFETEVEAATSEKNTTESWGLILEICDKAGKSSDDAKACLKAIYKRLNHNDPHVQKHAVTLLDACVSNCGKTFHFEVASREFENEYTKLLKKCHPTVQQKLKECLKKWAEGEFKSDPQLNLIPSLYNRLKNSGVDFTVEMPIKKTITLSKDPNVVQSEEEEEQIAKAIELSLRETSASSRALTTTTAATSSLYPTANLASAVTTSAASSPTPQKDLRKVRALYDFEAAEDNELTFNAGEIIFVIDETDKNWWKGSNQRGEGLFPANFVTADLSAEPEQFTIEKNKKLVQFNDQVEVKNVEPEQPQEVEINEEKIDRLLHLLHDADTTNPENDDEEMLRLEREANAMGPLIDSELEQVDRKHAQLTKLSTDLVDALSLYHTLMREPQYAPINKMYQFPPNTQSASGMFHNGSLPPNTPIPGPQFMIGHSVTVQQDTEAGQASLPHPHSMMTAPPGGSMVLPPHMMYGEARGGGQVPHYGPLPGQPRPVHNNSAHGMYPGSLGPQQQQHQPHMQQGSLTRFPQHGLPTNFVPQNIPPGYSPLPSLPGGGSQTVLQGSGSAGQMSGNYTPANSTHIMQ